MSLDSSTDMVTVLVVSVDFEIVEIICSLEK
jgi:hypothetical protein